MSARRRTCVPFVASRFAGRSKTLTRRQASPSPATSSWTTATTTTTVMADTTSPSRPERETTDSSDEGRHDSLVRRIFSPFSPSALASLPKKTFERRPRYTRADNVPDAEQDEHGQMPTVRDYHAINNVPPQVRVPKKVATPIKVEGKVWFANERSAYSAVSCYCLVRISTHMSTI